MAVVLLDPTRPDLIPAGAVAFLADTVAVTEDVHPSVLWELPSYELTALVGDDGTKTLVSSDREHPAVQARIRAGEIVVEGHPKSGGTLLKAVELMDTLRRTGPWERLQTHHSLRRYLLEEVYELLDSIDHGTSAELRSELGDVLLQVLFHARIAADAAVDSFDIDDVAQSFIDKVSSRTPGVLGGDHSDLDRQIDEWEQAKAAERAASSVLDGVVTTQPALSLVQKVFERLAGADFPVAAVSPSLYRVDVPFRKHMASSVEDDLRRRAIALMDDVRRAEAAAGEDGVVPRDENTWRKYLGMDFLDEAAAPGATDCDDGADDEEVLLDDADDEDLADLADYADEDYADQNHADQNHADASDADDRYADDDYEETIVDEDPVARGKKGKKRKVKGVKVKKKVPDIVVHEKWSAAGE
ncbi:MazG family protein [Gordonia shandongensis]|uniref:MazG family protein n=1 Tax=Gordonia shandongensis TaxID=376351 RepID=UPI00042A0621|nr:MazG family protein [Gordonia shandongensis]